MWAPRSWSDIVSMLGNAEETSTVDFKGELSSSRELAKDVAAMTLNGGVLIYGVTENEESQLADSISKISFKQVEERIQQIIGSRVAPVPETEVLLLREAEGDTDGVIVLIVPPSSLAPHQAGERYPRRLGTTTA